MRPALLLILLLSSWRLSAQFANDAPSPNIVIVTIDGLRWQELFNGADQHIINAGYVADTGLVNEMYWDKDTLERRRKLMPFLWNVVAKKGQVYGNRKYNNLVNVANRYKFSYPGYSEMFTGYPDKRFVPNTPVLNRNTNILEFLNKQEEYKGKVAAFSSWNVFPYILNEQRSGIPVNSGYEQPEDTGTFADLLDSVQRTVANGNTRYDELTYLNAREYVKKHHPKVLLLSFGEADEFAHHGHYDKYLQSIAGVDRMISELWYYIQTDPFYKNNTTLIITTDHGRGKKIDSWTDHLFLIRGSKEIWMAIMGPGILPAGEVKTSQVIYQKQIAGTIAQLAGKHFSCEHSVAKSIVLPQQPAEQPSSGIALDRK